MADIKGQINKTQALITLKRAGMAALVAVLIVLEADLPMFVDAAAPVGIFAAIAIAQARKFLESGSTISTPVKDK